MQIPKGHLIFLTDAAGAAVSLLGLYFLYTFDEFFGMPQAVVKYFMVIAALLFVYSLTVFLIKPLNWRSFLKWLAILNILYCLFTIFQLFRNTRTLTLYGYGYLIIEVLIILFIAIIELKRSAYKGH